MARQTGELEQQRRPVLAAEWGEQPDDPGCFVPLGAAGRVAPCLTGYSLLLDGVRTRIDPVPPRLLHRQCRRHGECNATRRGLLCLSIRSPRLPL